MNSVFTFTTAISWGLKLGPLYIFLRFPAFRQHYGTLNWIWAKR